MYKMKSENLLYYIMYDISC